MLVKLTRSFASRHRNIGARGNGAGHVLAWSVYTAPAWRATLLMFYTTYLTSLAYILDVGMALCIEWDSRHLIGRVGRGMA